MNDGSAPPSAEPSASQSPVSAPSGLAPLPVLEAAADPMRYAVLRELADGSVPPVIRLAKQLDCHPDQMGRHLQRMRKAGILIRVRPGDEADKRSKYYQVPAHFRQTLPDGQLVLDFGSVVLRFPPRAP